MFNQRETKLKIKIDNFEIKLESIEQRHQNAIDRINLAHQIELDETKHLVKLKEEKLDIENEKTHLNLQQNYSVKEMELQKKYHDKVLSNIEKAQKDLKDLYKEIIIRLPKINVGVKKVIDHESDT